MPLQETSGAASYDAFGGGPPFEPVYIESVFSTTLYTGNGSTQTITNGIDLAGKGGLVWTKCRSVDRSHSAFDTNRGVSLALSQNTTIAQYSSSGVTAFNNNGFTLGSAAQANFNGDTFASWTFRKQPKFFDVVTWTGNGTGSRAISHSLASTPGCIILKRTDSADDWWVVHRSASNFGNYAVLNTTAAFTSSINSGISSVGSTSFTVSAYYNSSGATWVAYIFGHDAGGFGLTGTDNVITCGEFTTDGSGNATVNLGYEPQWALIKPRNSTGDWVLIDTMRSWVVGGNNDALLYANTSDAEITGNNFGNPTATGFTVGGLTFSNTSYIYIAIRRGPMKTPTTGTSVFNPLARTGTSINPTVVTTNNNPDLLMSFPRTASPAAYGMCFWDKLRGISPMLQSSTTSAEISTNTTRVLQGWLNTGYQAGADFAEGYLNYSGSTYINYPITRAPGFFDVVCYTGTGSATTVAHNLGVVPELILVKRRDATFAGRVYSATLGNTKFLQLFSATGNAAEANTGAGSNGEWNATTPTSSVFSVGAVSATNGSGFTFVAYLFASCPGVSKVGSYTGTGALQTINCGFTGGARFVLIKRTDSTGDWFVYDSARGISSGNDPYLLLNSTAAEVTGTNYVDTTSVGFQVTAAAPAGLNANGGSYIFLAIS